MRDASSRQCAAANASSLDYFDVLLFLIAATLLPLTLELFVMLGWTARASLVRPPLGFQAGGILALLAALALIVKVRHQRPVARELGWIWPGSKFMALAVVAGAVMAAAVAWVAAGRYPLVPRIDWRVGIPLAVAFGPALEESFFRGCLLPVVERAWGLPAAVILTSLLFGALHSPSDLLHYACLALSGVAYAGMRVASRSTAAAALMHSAYNLALLTWPRVWLGR